MSYPCIVFPHFIWAASHLKVLDRVSLEKHDLDSQNLDSEESDVSHIPSLLYTLDPSVPADGSQL